MLSRPSRTTPGTPPAKGIAQEEIKQILNIVVVVVVVLWLLNVFGVWGHLREVRVSTQSTSLGTCTS